MGIRLLLDFLKSNSTALIKTVTVLSSAYNLRVSEIFLRNQHTNRQVMPEICRFIQILKIVISKLFF